MTPKNQEQKIVSDASAAARSLSHEQPREKRVLNRQEVVKVVLPENPLADTFGGAVMAELELGGEKYEHGDVPPRKIVLLRILDEHDNQYNFMARRASQSHKPTSRNLLLLLKRDGESGDKIEAAAFLDEGPSKAHLIGSRGNIRWFMPHGDVLEPDSWNPLLTERLALEQVHLTVDENTATIQNIGDNHITVEASAYQDNPFAP